jgi:hypothetical protein
MVVMAPSAVQSTLEIAESLEPEPVISEANTNATRHLSAGAYLDPEFCLTALREVYYKTKRVAAPSYGFNAITVLGHCLRARRGLVVRDVILVGLLVAASWLSLAALLIVLATLLTVHVTVVTVKVVRDALRYLREPPDARKSPEAERLRIWRAAREKRDVRRWRRGFRRLWLENVLAQIGGRLIGPVSGYLALLAVGATLAIAVWHTSLTGRTRLGIRPTLATVGLVALMFLVPAAARAWGRLQVRALAPDRAPHPPMATRRLADIERQTGGNTVIYSGYQPFVGSGENLWHWNFAQRLVRTSPKGLVLPDAEREFDEPPFTAREISAYVRDHISDLAHDPLPERRLPALTVADRVFVAGTEVSDLTPHTPQDQVARIIRNPTAPQRHYVACQVVSWRGELVTTVYVHFAVQGKVLYVELHITGLLPCDERYRVVDQLDGTSLGRVLRDAAEGLLSAPTVVASAPVGLWRAGSDVLGLTAARSSATARLKKGFDYGALIGLREIGEAPDIRDHMRTQDIIKYGRMIERRVIDAVLDFLEDKNVDVTEYRQRFVMILNAGAIAANGGTVNVGGDAIGNVNASTEGAGG